MPVDTKPGRAYDSRMSSKQAASKDRPYRIEATLSVKQGRILYRYLLATGDKKSIWLRRLILRELQAIGNKEAKDEWGAKPRTMLKVATVHEFLRELQAMENKEAKDA